MKNSAIIRCLISALVALVSCLWLTSCDPFHQSFKHTVIYERDNNLNEYMVFFYRPRYLETVFEKDTLLLSSPRVVEEYEDVPAPRKTKEFWVNTLVKDHLLGEVDRLDSIGVYSIDDHKLQGMMYHPTIEKRDNLKSSTLYPNPFSEASWVLDFKDSEYNKNKWGVNIADLTYTLKRLETP